MRKRLKKKIHKLNLSEICCWISQENEWREKLFKSEFNTKFIIDRNQKPIHNYVKKHIYKYNLRYYVSLVSGYDVSDDIIYSFFDNYDKENRESIFFKFEPVEFPEYFVYSLNG